MVNWDARDKAAIQAIELDAGSQGATADMEQFVSEDYTGPSCNSLVSVWNWIRRKVNQVH
jgi:hypothetical protein